jgi:hypothetical protein
VRYFSLVLWLLRGPGLAADTAVYPAVPAKPALVAQTTAMAPESARPAPGGTPAVVPGLGPESATYRVSFGIFGEVARATVTYTPEAPPEGGGAGGGRIVRLVGSGDGTVLGFGRTEKRIESEFDPATLAARRWTNVRSTSSQTTADGAVQATAGSLALLRKRTGQPDLPESFTRSVPVLDPLSFLLRLRLALPTTPTTCEILDGRALWIAALGAAHPDPDDATLLRVEGQMDPVYWNGSVDPERSRHTFSLFFTADRYHTPIRLVVPHALGEFRAELVRLERPQATGKTSLFAVSPACRSQSGRLLCTALSPLVSLRPISR